MWPNLWLFFFFFCRLMEKEKKTSKAKKREAPEGKVFETLARVVVLLFFGVLWFDSSFPLFFSFFVLLWFWFFINAVVSILLLWCMMSLSYEVWGFCVCGVKLLGFCKHEEWTSCVQCWGVKFHVCKVFLSIWGVRFCIYVVWGC